jgi:hypothetical protein
MKGLSDFWHEAFQKRKKKEEKIINICTGVPFRVLYLNGEAMG